MAKQRILFVTDFSITSKDVLENIHRFDPYDVTVDTAEISMGEDEAARAAYILKTETEGPEWFTPPSELLEKAAEADILITDFVAIGSKVIEAAPKLKLIGVLRSGVENVCLSAARARNIPVICSPGRVAAPVADYTVGMIIAESRNIARSSLTANHGQWIIRFSNYPYSHNLADKTVGIIGYGAIGQMVAARLRAFGCRIQAYENYIPAERVRELGAEPVSLETLLQTSDFVTIHARLSEQTRGMLGRREFEMMKPSAFFINTARAGLIDEAALIEVLKAHKIAGAALDVFAHEPIEADNPLLSLDNVTLTPHLAGTTSNVASNSIAVILKDLDRYFHGQPMVNLR